MTFEVMAVAPLLLERSNVVKARVIAMTEVKETSN
jgi:hypothetical protein